jgi:quinol monooxygenase YgiN
MPSIRTAASLLTVASLMTFALAASPAPAEEKPNPIAAQVKAALKDPDRPFTLVVHLQVKKEAAKKFEAAVARAAKPTRKEKGCLAYDLNRDPKMPARYLLYERWQNLEALETHLKSRHITTLLMEIGDLLAGPPKADVLLPAGD